MTLDSADGVTAKSCADGRDRAQAATVDRAPADDFTAVTDDSAADVQTGTMPSHDVPGLTCRRRALSQWRLIMTCVVLLGCAGGAALLYITQFRIDHQMDSAAARQALSAATEGTAMVLSYTPQSLDRDLAAAKSRLTGDFLTYYSKFADQVLAPAAKEKAIKTTAAVLQAAVCEQRPDQVKVLLFLNQTTVSRDRPDPVETASSVMVSMTKTADRWLISAFNPL